MLRREIGSQLLPRHQRQELALVERVGTLVGDDVAVSHHDDALADGEDLLKPVRHVHHGRAVVPKPTDELEEPFRFGRAKSGSRLIEEQVLRAGAQGTRDLDELTVGWREGLDEDVGAEPGADAVEPRRGDGTCAALRIDAPLGRLPAQQQILSHAHAGHEDGLLADRIDAHVAGVLRIESRHARSRDGHRSGVGMLGSRDERDERGLAGAVLPDQASHLARAERHRGVGHGHHGAVPFRYALERQGVRIFGRSHNLVAGADRQDWDWRAQRAVAEMGGRVEER